MVITDGSGNTRFDSNEKLFVITDFISGTVTASSHTATLSASSRGVITDNVADTSSNYTLASCNAYANTIRGAFYMTTSDARGLSVAGWFNASGSYVHMWEGGGGVISAFTDNVRLSCVTSYTFFVSGGVVYLNERVRMSSAYAPTPPYSTSVTVAAPTFQYKLFAGTFV